MKDLSSRVEEVSLLLTTVRPDILESVSNVVT